MSAALKTAEISDEALAFVRQGTPKSVVPAVVSEIPTEASDARGLSVSERGAEPSPPLVRAKAIASKKVAAPLSAMIGLSFRLPEEIHHALMRASFERKMNREEPWTQQEIVAEALVNWLKKQE